MHIENVEVINSLFLDIDYDDGFVAYLNGVEIARDNINGAVPNYLSFAITDKESKMYTGQEPDRFDLMNFIDLLRDGENVLAIQVHNNVTSSSDMTLRPFLTARYLANTQDGSDLHPLLDYAQTRLHTDFKISSSAETLYLIEPNGNIHDSIVIENLPTDISYGYTPAGALGYFDIATPEAINSSEAFQGKLIDDIQFSDDGGQVDALTIGLSTSTPFTSIRYTTDATEPNENSTLYTSPINLSSSSVIRARLFRSGYIPSDVTSRNYIIGEDHLIPVVSLISDPVNIFDEEYGIYSYGNNYTNELPFFGANFWEDWERPVHFSYYGMDNNLNIAINAGAKIFGGWSRAFDQRSFSIFARKKYGPSDINYPLFSERAQQSYGAIVLRNSGNDNTASHMRDIIVHELIKDLDLESQAYQTVATYINDEYWGIYHMREKVNEHFLANKYDIDPESIDLLEFEGIAIHGDNEDYQTLLNLVNSGNVANPDVYQAIEERVDIDNFIDYFATQIYIDNSDWPGNNIKFWKPENGKWRWILYDTDFAFNLFNEFGHYHNTLGFALATNGPDWPNPPWSTEVFRGLVQNEDFRIKLVNRFADFMNSRFRTENILSIIDNKIDELQPEIERHFERWNGDMTNWIGNINRIRTFADLRPDQMKNHIRSEFGLPATHTLTIDNQEIEAGYVQVSTLTIKESEWNGDYFENNPFTVKAIAKPGYTFSHWSSNTFNDISAETITIDMSNSLTVTPNFEVDNIEDPTCIINEINYKSAAETDAGDWIELHNPSSVDLDLSGWYIQDENDENIYQLPNINLEPNQFAIIVADADKFESIYPNIDFIGEIDFGFSSDDQVRLFDSNGFIIDSVDYNNMAPWPTSANGEGYTLELINPSLDNNLAENYNTINTHGSPGRSNVLDTSVDDKYLLHSLRVFPNPTSDILNVNFTLSSSEIVDLELINMDGRIVQTLQSIECHSGKNKLSVDVKDLITGAYNLIIKNQNAVIMTMRWAKI